MANTNTAGGGPGGGCACQKKEEGHAPALGIWFLPAQYPVLSGILRSACDSRCLVLINQLQWV